MFLYSDCVNCLISAQKRRIENYADEKAKSDYMIEVAKAIGESPDGENAPHLTYKLCLVFEKHFGKDETFAKMKSDFNRLLLKIEDDIRQKINGKPDPLKAAIIYARKGNYIDFSSVENMSDEDVLLFLEDENGSLDDAEYSNLCAELEDAENLLYILDNCGEIVIDKIVIEEIKRRFSQIRVTAMVRGGEALNDTTISDAEESGLSDVAEIVTTGIPMQGVSLDDLPPESVKAFSNADVIISKGQGNFESLGGCGANIYYLFLCKCELFTRKFGVPRFTGMFINEKRLPKTVF